MQTQQHHAGLTLLPSTDPATVFAVRRAGYAITDVRNGRLETVHSSFGREKRPRRQRQYIGALPDGGTDRGPDFPGAA